MPKIIRFDPALHPSQFPERPLPDEEEVVRDIDELFQSLGAGLVMRRIIRLRLLGLPHRDIAARCKIGEHTVRVHLARARKLITEAGVLDRETDESVSAPVGSKLSGIVRTRERAAVEVRPGRREAPESVSRAAAEATSHHSVLRRPAVKGSSTPDGAREPYRVPGRLTAAQSFGWRDVYYSEVHRCQPPRWNKP